MSPPVEEAFASLTTYLAEQRYTFICPSPESQARVIKRREANPRTTAATSLEDFFGRNLPATRETLVKLLGREQFDIVTLSDVASSKTPVVSRTEDKYRSAIRISNFSLPRFPPSNNSSTATYYIHSPLPNTHDSVFFGPDTYLFLDYLTQSTQHLPASPGAVVDNCCGAGAGAIHLARYYAQTTTPQQQQPTVYGLDLSPSALRLARLNAYVSGTTLTLLESDLYTALPAATRCDVIVSNPPYIASSSEEGLPIYADGGRQQGLELSLRIVVEGLERLSERGVLVMYTGVAVSIEEPGRDMLLEAVKGMERAEVLDYRVLEPDMWAEEVGTGAYVDVERIQVVGLVVRRKKVL